jgi:PRA1 family protein 1
MSTFTELKVSATTGDLPAPSTASGSDNAAAGATAVAAASAIGRMAGMVPSLDGVKERLGDVWTRSRPWSEFANTSQMGRPEAIGDVLERVKENAEYYAFNYLVILVVMSGLTILTSPLAFLGGMFIVAAYFYLYFLNPEPLVVAGITFDNNIKAASITLFSLIVLWLTGAGATFTGLVFFVGIVALTHAALRKPPGEADFETAYTPATV